MIRILRSFTLAALLGLLVLPVQAQEKLFYPACPGFSDDNPFTCYRTYDEVAAFLQEAVRQHPDKAKLSSFGKSYEGRDLWLVTITDYSTGAPEDKPALWVDGGVDSDEVISTEAALGLIHRLLTSDDDEMAERLRNRTFYIAPNIIPDMSELHHTTPIRPHDSTMRPWDEDGDGKLDEDPPDDLDGDNHALQMRVEDPAGIWVKEEDDDRLMRRRKLGDEGPFYTLYTEGLDNDGDGRYNEDWPGGVDPNRNYPGNWSIRQNGSGPYPGSESETRAQLEFVLDHPNIAASQHLHSTGGVILRPPSVPDFNLPTADRLVYVAMAEKGLEVSGYDLATSVYDWNWPRGSRNTKRGQLWRDTSGEIKGVEAAQIGGNLYAPLPESEGYAAYGGSIDGMYALFGVLAFANEIYSFGEDLDGDGSKSNLERLQYDDEHMNGEVFRNWMPFDHPDLGPVEIGGWKKFGQNNPIGEHLNVEVQRNVDFMLLQADEMPMLGIQESSVENLGGGLSRVSVTVMNMRFQPTELAIRVNNRRAVPVRAWINLPDGAELIDGEMEEDLGHIGGHKTAEVTWLIRSTNGGQATVKASHPKAGSASVQLSLD